MTDTFDCPSCGGALVEIRPDETLTLCPYCNSSVVVPSELRERASGAQDSALRAAASPAIEEIGNLLSRGRKIDAIRLYREVFDTGLKEAKNAVEALEAGGKLPIASSFVASAAQQPADASVVQGEIRGLLREGKKIDAIKRYREAYTVGLKEAKEAVEAIDVGVWNPPTTRPTFSGYRMQDSQAAYFAQMVAEGRREEAIQYYRKVFDVSTTQAREAVEKVLAGKKDVLPRRTQAPASYEAALSDLAARAEAPAGSGRQTGRRLALVMGIALVVLFCVVFAAILVMAQ